MDDEGSCLGWLAFVCAPFVVVFGWLWLNQFLPMGPLTIGFLIGGGGMMAVYEFDHWWPGRR